MGNLELHGYDSDALVGTKVASFEILQCLGEGGMGAVYLAKQDVPRRKVALKVVKPGMDSKQVLTRFRLEQENLGLMNHPSIAAVYEAGLSDQGRPYFAMEWVDGLPIDTYCKQHKLSIRDRLALIVQVGKALQYAHQRGIIHRDIKPANILVTEKAGKPLVKIIDFGISKAIYRGMDPNTLALELSRPLTTAGMVVGTIGYMSPEQACADESEVDTRTDVYALGALAYELLVARPPFLLSDFPKVPLPVVLIKMQSQEPVKPSSAVYKSGEVESHLQSLGLQSPHKFKRVLKGDLEWIVMKALSREKDRRYSSVGDCIEDVERYLEGRPVSAGPVSLGYLLGKWVRRHKLLVTVGSTVLLVLLGAGVQTYLAEQKAQEEAIQTRETLRLMTEFLTEVDPDKSGKDLKVITLLDDFYQKVEKAEHLSKESQATLYQTIGKTYYNLGSNREALPILQKAYDLFVQIHGEQSLETNQIRWDLANACSRGESYRRVISLTEQNCKNIELAGLDKESFYWKNISLKGNSLTLLGDLNQGFNLVNAAFEEICEKGKGDAVEKINSAYIKSRALIGLGRLEEAWVCLDYGETLIRTSGFVKHRYEAMFSLERIYWFYKTGNFEQAREYFDCLSEVIDDFLVVDEHSYVVRYFEMGSLLFVQEDLCSESERFLSKALHCYSGASIPIIYRVKILVEQVFCLERKGFIAEALGLILCILDKNVFTGLPVDMRAFLLNEAGFLFMKMEMFDLASFYATEAVDLAEKYLGKLNQYTLLPMATLIEIEFYSGNEELATEAIDELIFYYKMRAGCNDKMLNILKGVKQDFKTRLQEAM